MLKRREMLPAALIFSGIFLISWMFLLPIIEARASFENPGSYLVSPTNVNFIKDLSRNFNLPKLPFSSLFTSSRSSNDFFLTIERLGIKKARVIANLDGADQSIYLNELLRGIGHLKGSAFPGEAGNVFLFGHSSLPFFFSSDNYSAIFSNLGKLKRGDEVSIEFAGRTYLYRVSDSKIVSPDASLSEFSSSKARLTILTCYPPGLLNKRLIVTADPLSE